MKAFVTGGTGFLGTNLVKQLNDNNWEIYALHRRTSDVRTLQACERVRLVEGDILDLDSLLNGMQEGIDAVFHCAGSVANLPHSQEKSRYATNQIGTKNVVEASLSRGARRCIYTTTVLTYDFKAVQPLTENAPPNRWSRDAYIHSKRLADEEMEKGLEKGLDAVFMHPSALFGAYDTNTWSKMFREVHRGLPLPCAPPGGLSASHALPVAKAHLAAYHKAQAGEHFLLGGPDVTLLEILGEVARLVGKSPPSIPLPAPIFKAYGWSEFLISSMIGREPMLTPHTINILCESIYSDSSKAERELGYESTTLSEMLTDCYDWMVETNQLTEKTR